MIFFFLNQLNKVTLCFRLNYKLHFLTLGIFSIQYINLLAKHARGLTVWMEDVFPHLNAVLLANHG